jgi:DNA polymerase-3 subunit delta
MAKRASKPGARTGLDETCRVGLLAGKESFLRHLHTQALREALVKRHGSVDTVLYDGEAASAADVLDECRSFGLIATHKLVILDRAEMLIREETRVLFERYCREVVGREAVGATLLLRAETWRPGNLDALIEAAGGIVRCDEPTPEAASHWVVQRARKAHETEITPEAAVMLVERVGVNLARLDGELGKLAAAAGAAKKAGAGDGRVTGALVAYFVGPSREEEVWGIQRTLLTASPEEALGHLRYVLEVARQPATLVSYALVDLARKVHAASRAMKGGRSPGQVLGMKSLRLWGPSGQAIVEAARRTDPDRALELLRLAVRGDQRSKSGLGEPERTLEMVVLEMSQTLGVR